MSAMRALCTGVRIADKRPHVRIMSAMCALHASVPIVYSVGNSAPVCTYVYLSAMCTVVACVPCAHMRPLCALVRGVDGRLVIFGWCYDCSGRLGW